VTGLRHRHLLQGRPAVRPFFHERHKRLIAALIAERKKAGIRQVELAKKLKRSQTFVARMESGRRRIDVIEFMDLADAIGFNAPKLLESLFQVPHGRGNSTRAR
jgi:transcriptional regulator with XRE-family HTH domain